MRVQAAFLVPSITVRSLVTPARIVSTAEAAPYGKAAAITMVDCPPGAMRAPPAGAIRPVCG